MTNVLRVTNMHSLRLFIIYVKERFKITTRVRQEACKERISLLAQSHSIICDDVDDDTPVEAIISDMETLFRCFPKVVIMQTPWLPNFEAVVEEMVDTYKEYVEARPTLRFLKHPSGITLYAHMKFGRAETSNKSFFNRRLTQFLNDPYTSIASKFEICSAHGILRWMTYPPPKDLDDQTPADIVNWELSKTFFRQDFGGFDYDGAFEGDENPVETRKGKSMRSDFSK
jgi:hypothetical protein